MAGCQRDSFKPQCSQALGQSSKHARKTAFVLGRKSKHDVKTVPYYTVHLGMLPTGDEPSEKKYIRNNFEDHVIKFGRPSSRSKPSHLLPVAVVRL